MNEFNTDEADELRVKGMLVTSNMPLPKERKIFTGHVNPPIPLRCCDWVAFREGNEETGPFYWGATEAEAIAELKENEEEE
jgi:hypothetical protein